MKRTYHLAIEKEAENTVLEQECVPEQDVKS